MAGAASGPSFVAANFYASIFPGAEIKRLEHWGPGGPGASGSVKQAELDLHGHRLRFFDSPVRHAFGFTPAISLFVECDSEAELTGAFTQLAEGGQVLMPLGPYDFSPLFGWTNDRFGVSWQLSLA